MIRELLTRFLAWAIRKEKEKGSYATFRVFGWDDLLWMIAVWVLSAALTPRPKAPQPASIQDFEFPQADEGTPQAVIFGDCWTGGWMVLTYGNFRTTPIRR